MPYGFIKHIENRGYSSETVKSYQRVCEQFFLFIKNTYLANKEPFQISPTDIKNYLEEQLDKEKSISTINKELAILKTLFNFLWEIDKVPVDPAVKLKRFKNTDDLKIEVPYQQILEILNKTFHNQSYSPLRKAIFLLATKGLKTADFRFKKDDVLIAENKVEIKLKNRTIYLEEEEATYFKSYFDETMLNGSEYVFVTKQHGEETGGPVQVMSILHHLRTISKDYLQEGAQALTLISIRRALAYYLYASKDPIQMIAKELGIEEISASNYLKQITEALQSQNYVVER
ncbi:tyrosine-type recombinase/integrase [Bacillus sp. 1NLA3E]|uniref:tyrosine-type recombinase/integrase n=1 Tax=Bacillus sp. 1NLA3E TaxID=666686 RepID=UPI000247F2BF|nr:phage integrase N-terminal SAM-like domain-containing protein [Bacillus sp. 1NLA3E]